MARKPQPGACGQCGVAVVRPTEAEISIHLDLPFVDQYDFWLNGHHYVYNVLWEVRCKDHEPRPVGWD